MLIKTPQLVILSRQIRPNLNKKPKTLLIGQQVKDLMVDIDSGVDIDEV